MRKQVVPPSCSHIGAFPRGHVYLYALAHLHDPAATFPNFPLECCAACVCWGNANPLQQPRWGRCWILLTWALRVQSPEALHLIVAPATWYLEGG